MRSEPGNPERADPEGVQALSVLTKPFFLAGATSQGKHLPKADFRGTASSLLSGFECSHVLLGAGHNTAKNGGQEKNLLRGGNPSLAQASASPGPSVLLPCPENLPAAGHSPAPFPSWGQQTCRGQAAAQRLARRPSAPRHSSALNFPTKRPAGGRKEGGLQGRQAEWADDSTAIPSDTGPSRGKEEEDEEEGTRLWIRRSPAGVCGGGCQG